MASRNPEALKQVTIDGETALVPAGSRIADVVSSDVTAVEVMDRHGKAQLLGREYFRSIVVPEGFTTYQTPVARGGVRGSA